MSAESDFLDILEAHTGLNALVSGRIAQNGVTVETPVPYVVFTSQHTPDYGLANTLLSTNVQFRIECWADDAAEADAVADQVQAALLAENVVCTSRLTGQDPAVGLQATILVADWWQ